MGPAISAEQAREIIHVTSLAPVEGARKIVVLHDFHLLTAEAAARLLKPIEEPPPSTTFLVLADFVPPELITIASRCVRIEFRSIPDADPGRPAARRGGRPTMPSTTSSRPPAATSRGRASSPPTPTSSSAAGRSPTVPSRLDGTGAAVMATVDDLLARIEAAAAPLAERHATEVAELDARIERFGERGSGRKALEERHKRELRRHRTDELRSGLGVLAGAYRDILVGGTPQHPQARRRRRDAASTARSSRWSTTPTRRCSCNHSCGRCPSRDGYVASVILRALAALPTDAVQRSHGDHREGDAVDRAADAVQLERRADRRRSARSGRRAPCGRRRTGARGPPRTSAAASRTTSNHSASPHPSRPNASSSDGMPPTMHADERQHRQRADDEAEAERSRAGRAAST